MSGPTKNPEYNALLIQWAAAGYGSEPECEDCGKDLTGEDVIDDGCMWVCTDCSEADEDDELVFSERTLRDFERKQMGIGS